MNEQDRHIAVWNNCLQIIVSNIDRQQFDTWFKPIRPVSLVESTLTVEVPSDFFREYLEGAYLHLLKSALKRAIGADAKLVYMVRPVRSEQAMVYPAAATTNPVNPTVSISTYHPSGNPGPFVFPGIQRVQINPRLKAEYCFENLVEGECNKMGITAGESISKAPGKTPFNPLFLFGGPGLGKTHLSQAIGIAVKQRYPELVVLYVTGNEFKTQYMDAAMGGKLTDFMAYYMRMDVLIVDDIQGLLGQGSQNAFFNVFNHLHQSGKQLIFTSDRAPVDLKNFEERLLSRFKWGLSVELSRPDFATRLSMLKSRSFREVVCDEPGDISIDRILSTVCDYFNITREDMLSKSRKRPIVQARQIAMYECRNLIANCSLSTIGAELGGKDHATVLHACTTVQDLMTTDKAFRQYIGDIEEMLLATVAR